MAANIALQATELFCFHGGVTEDSGHLRNNAASLGDWSVNNHPTVQDSRPISSLPRKV